MTLIQIGLVLDEVLVVTDTVGVYPQIVAPDPFSVARVFKSKLRVLAPLALTVTLCVELGVYMTSRMQWFPTELTKVIAYVKCPYISLSVRLPGFIFLTLLAPFLNLMTIAV
jgi:hypothetical protein